MQTTSRIPRPHSLPRSPPPSPPILCNPSLRGESHIPSPSPHPDPQELVVPTFDGQNRQSLGFTERCQLPQAIPRFHLERKLHQRKPILRSGQRRQGLPISVFCWAEGGRYDHQRMPRHLPMPVRADFREGDEDSNFSVFRVRRFTEWPGPLH